MWNLLLRQRKDRPSEATAADRGWLPKLPAIVLAAAIAAAIAGWLITR